ncbi:MAG: single-stranded-DNA-specific exonuclease RecJ [Anaerolineae bacterium]|nr:single-stranded-DNA-specific exonuclease RecJ [Anaerolineae bacterium]
MGILGRKRWQIAPPAPQPFLERLPHIEPQVAQLLYNRGIVEPAAIEAFLNGACVFNNPFALKDMDLAVTLLRQTILRGASIVVYGDYDVDGVTASAVLIQTLRVLGAHVEAYIPNREDEGYGLNMDAIAKLAESGTALMLTVDCGIRSLEEIAYARQVGLKVIVTDHHHLGAALPAANAVINPKREDCNYPFKDLAGVGVAFKLAQALLRTNLRVPLPATQSTMDEDELLDLVALGTVADMVPLLGENHVLVRRGLASINSARRPGISALMDVASISPGKVTTDTIGFSLAPRLNAAGRISEAQRALDLLLAPDMLSALPLAQELNTLNQERRAMTLALQDAARNVAFQDSKLGSINDEIPPLLFAALDGFAAGLGSISGIVGLGASRLLDEFYRPAVVVAIEGELSKGSARSIPEFHITEALDRLSDLLVRHGGHAAAAGFTIYTELLPEFRARLTAIAREELGGISLAPTFQVDAEVALGGLSWDLYYKLCSLEPFGYGNPTPTFVSRRVRVSHARAVGAEGQHLKLYLVDECGKSWDAIAFRQGEWIKALPDWIDIAYELQANEWNGRTTLQLRIKDIHFTDSD